ncbi:acetoin utilization AcuB family protein [soil metagenome]
MLVRDHMKRDPRTVTPDDTLATALNLTREHRIRHLPVVLSTGGLTGIVSDRDIRLAMPSPLAVADAERAEFLSRTSVAEVMTRDVITVSANDTIEDAANLLYQHRIGSLPVVSTDGQLHGILTETDILHAFVLILGGAKPSSRIEIGLRDEPGELARAIKIIGDDLRMNIASIVVPSLPEKTRRVAIVHLATIDPREVVRALEEAGYDVGWPSLEKDLRMSEAR